MKIRIVIASSLLSFAIFYSCQNAITPPPPLYDSPQPFVIDYRSAANSPVDVSFLLEKPAGKSGFITVKDGKFVKPDGSRIRLWGVNITDWTRGSVQIPDKEQSVFYADVLARLGINCVRLTFLDFFTPRGLIDPNRNDTRKLDPEQLDKLDFWIAELKKKGIYTDLNLLVGRTYKAGDQVAEYDNVGWAKYVSYFDPQLIKLQKEFAMELLTHHNPYTQSEYRSEPAVAIVELVNENSLFDAWYRDALHPSDNPQRDVNFRHLTKHHSDMLTSLFNKYLAKHYDQEAQDKIRSQSGAKANELVPRPRKNQYASAGEDWFQATVAFYTDVEKQFFLEMKQYLKETLQVKPLLLGSNDFLHNQSEYPMVESNAVLDILDGHVYWQHPSWPGKQNTPMVNEPDSSTVSKLSRTAVSGIPYTVTEVNHAYPNDYECEGIPIIAAYGGFQDWDGLMLYTFEPKVAPDYVGYVGDAFDISHHPVKIPQMVAGALMYLRGDVKNGSQTVERTYTKEQMAETMRMPGTDAPYYTHGYAPSYVFKHKVRIGSMEGPPTQTFEPVTDNPLVSDTKELNWNTTQKEKGVVTVNTPFTQALIGFVKDNNPNADNLSAFINNDFCSITLSSLDNQPISKSAAMLLTTGGKVVNTVSEANNTDRRSRRGGPPSLIEVISGLIVLSDLEGAKSVEVKALNGAGVPFGEPVKAERSGKKWIIPIGNEVTTWYIIDVKRYLHSYFSRFASLRENDRAKTQSINK